MVQPEPVLLETSPKTSAIIYLKFTTHSGDLRSCWTYDWTLDTVRVIIRGQWAELTAEYYSREMFFSTATLPRAWKYAQRSRPAFATRI
jgi:hypothetical protein